MARIVTASQRAQLAAVQRQVEGVAARERTLPVVPALGGLLPQGVQRGSVVGCAGPAAVSLALAVMAGASQAGAWVVAAGLPGLGLAAAEEMGVVAARLVQVVEPAAEPWDDARWGDVLAAMVDGFDMVLVGPGAQGVRPATARRVTARLQARGAVMVCVGAPAFGADLLLGSEQHQWAGLGDGHGVATSRRVAAVLEGRRVPRPRRAVLWLPAAGGQVRAGTPAAADAADVAAAAAAEAAVAVADVATVVALQRTG